MCRGAAVPEPVPLSDGIAGDLGCDQEELGVAGDAVSCVSSCCSFDEPDRVSSQPGHALFLQPLPLACTVPPCLPRIFQVSKGLHLPSPALQTLHALNTAGYCILFWPSFLFFVPGRIPPSTTVGLLAALRLQVLLLTEVGMQQHCQGIAEKGDGAVTPVPPTFQRFAWPWLCREWWPAGQRGAQAGLSSLGPASTLDLSVWAFSQVLDDPGGSCVRTGIALLEQGACLQGYL